MTQELRKLAEAAIAFPQKVSVSQYPSMQHAKIVADQAFHGAANPAAILALLDRLEKAEKDAERLDWLDSQGYAYGFQDMHEGHRWTIDGPFANVRIAIDEAMEASK